MLKDEMPQRALSQCTVAGLCSKALRLSQLLELSHETQQTQQTLRRLDREHVQGHSHGD